MDKMVNFMLYVFHHSKEKENNGGKKASRLWKGVKVGKGTCKGLSPPFLSLPSTFLCPQAWAPVTEVHGPTNHTEETRPSGSSVSGTKEQRELDKGGPPNSTCEPIQATYVQDRLKTENRGFGKLNYIGTTTQRG